MNRDLAVANPDAAWALQPYETANGGAPSFSPTLDVVALIRILRQWRWVILALTAAGIAVALVFSLLSTPMYRATVVLQVNPPEVPILDDKMAAEADGQTSWDSVATQVGLLSSRSVAERVTQDLNLANNPNFIPQDQDASKRLKEATDKVEDHLNVVPPEDGELIKFTYDAESPVFSAQIANGLADAFINSNLQRKFESSAYARKFLEGQIRKTRAELEKSERQLVTYAQAQGIINTATDQTSSPLTTDANSPAGEALTDINKSLSEATARRIAAEGAYLAAQNGGITTTETASSQQLRQTRAAIQAQYQQKRILLKPDHPDMVSMRAEIAELDKEIRRENSNIEQSRINALRSDYNAAASAEQALRAKVGQLKGDVLNLRGRSIRYAILQREVDTNRTLYDALLQRYKEVGVAGGIGTAPVSIVDHANAPATPFKPNLPLNLVVGLVVGLLSGFVTAVALEFINDTVNNSQDVRTKLGLACLGTVAKASKRGGKVDFLEELKDPSSEISEAYSTIAASLGFSTETGAPKVLLLSSSRASEGKSSSALALAQNYSRRGKRVLLIDCDLRKPAFKTPPGGIGLTNLLTNSDNVAEHVTATHFPNLLLLPAGPLPPNPADLLSTGRFHGIIREASLHFDMIIVDAPPVIGLADAPLLAAICKDVMFVIESGKTRTGVAREAISKLEAAGAHIVGAILTKAVPGQHGYGYAYAYGYGQKSKYGAVGKTRTEISLIPDQSEG